MKKMNNTYVRFFMVLLMALSLCGCSLKTSHAEKGYEINHTLFPSVSASVVDEPSPEASDEEIKSFPSEQSDLMTSYDEVVIDEPYYWNTTKAVSFNAAYPVFVDPELAILNNAILEEVQSWYEIYDAICMFANEECTHNDKMASLGRHITSTYSVEETDNQLKVCFRVDYCMKLSNMEYWYEITFSYNYETRMLFETITTSRRIYG